MYVCQSIKLHVPCHHQGATQCTPAENFFRMSRFYFFELQRVSNNTFTIITDKNLLFLRDGQDLQRGGCLRDFRNRPNPVRLKLRYYENVLTVSAVIFIAGTVQL